MFKSIVFISLLCITSAFSSDELHYTAEHSSSLLSMITDCAIEVNDVVSVSLDLMSAFVLVDDSLIKNDLLNSPKPAHADKSFVTLSYKF